MKVSVIIQPEDKKEGDAAITFGLDLPGNYFNVANESAKLVTAVKNAAKNIYDELSKAE